MDFFAMFLSKSYKIFLSKIIFLTYFSSKYFMIYYSTLLCYFTDMANKVMIPKYTYKLIFGIYNYATFHGKLNFANMIIFRTWRWRKYPE